MGMGSGSGSGSVAEINVTPLIDVLLVLLIIFMVIVPVAPQGLRALVPQPPKSQSPETPPETIVVEVQNGANDAPMYQINGQSFAESAVGPKLSAIFATRQDKVMFVKGAPELRYETIAAVIGLAHQAGVTSVGMITPGVSSGR